MNQFSTIFAAIVLLLSSPLAAQTDDLPSLPRFASPEEAIFNTSARRGPEHTGGITDPPASPVRTMAEWEELQALVITWKGYQTILTEIVRAARLETKVVICCDNTAGITTAKNYLIGKNVDVSSNVEFTIAPSDAVWVRDYGPNCVYVNDVDSLLLVDWIYNRARFKDDVVSDSLARYFRLPLYSTYEAPLDLVNTGGNFMSDGMGLAFASKLVFTNNDQILNGECGNLNDVFGSSSHTETEIDDIMARFMGIRQYVKLDRLPYDCIHHIDMHIKLLDEETLLVGQYPTGIADGPQIEANLQYILSNFKTSFGTPFKVVRIPMPPEGTLYPHNGGDYRTYANAVFVNKTILVPFYTIQWDTVTQRIWQQAMPGYTIKGINCNAIIPALGAIHCITKEIGVADPLRIVHKSLEDVSDNAVPGYPVIATIQHRSGIAGGKIWWSKNPGGLWQPISMEKVPGDTSDLWTGLIPVQPEGSTIFYYIEGTANSGKTGLRPMPAPAGYWKFKILESSAAPEALAAAARLGAIFPNPARAVTCIPVFSERKTEGSVRIFNALGQPVRTVFEGTLTAGETNYCLDVSSLAPGFYAVEFRAGGRKMLRQLLVE